MDLYAEQLKLEEDMLSYGRERYLSETKKAEDNNRGSETSYAKRLISSLIQDTARIIEAYACTSTGVGKQTKAKVILRKLDFETSGYIALKTIFDSLIREDPLIKLSLNIGQRIEDQIRFTEFQESEPNLYKYIVDKFKDQNVLNYQHKHRVLTYAHSARIEWKNLSTNQKVQLGAVLIDLVVKATGMFTVKNIYMNKRRRKIIEVTPDTLSWIEEHIARFSLLFPDFAPTVIKPKKWVSQFDGGYYIKHLSKRCPFIKTKSSTQREGIKGHDYSITMQAVNKIQETPWRINTYVLQVMQEVYRRNLRIGMPSNEPTIIPKPAIDPDLKKADMNKEELEIFNVWKKEAADIYTSEKVRVSKCLLLGRIMSTAVKYSKYDKFYFVYNCDFRGRIYAASSGFSPQGPDYSKGVLEFAKGKPLGEDGFNWLCIHGANVFGFDKASYQDRIKWCLDRKDQLISIGLDAFSSGSMDIWSNADKPYQFIAFCKEFSEAVLNPIGYVSHLPIALDGSCNGIQHFSALLLDKVGAKAVNLVPSEKPKDIYADVAVVTTNKLKEIIESGLDTELHARYSLNFNVDRKICKKPVMTLPYGSTLNNCIRKTTEYITENKERSEWHQLEFYKGCSYLAKVIWSSIDEVVVAARIAMKYLKVLSNEVSDQNKAITYISPTGFKMYQSCMKFDSREIKTQLLGKCRMVLSYESPDINKIKQRSGISPNFIHCLDASHLVNTVNNCIDIQDFAMIHDSYGTHACNTTELAFKLRESFVDIYKDKNLLDDLRIQLQDTLGIELPEAPEQGDLDVSTVMQSEYFFG